MSDFTIEELDAILKRDMDDEIHEAALSAKEAIAALDQEDDLDKRRKLDESIRDDFTVLQYLLGEGSRGGEDFINDGVFHAQR